MNLKKILLGVFLFTAGFTLTIAFLIVMNGCASTDKAKVIDEIATIAKEKMKQDESTSTNEQTETVNTENNNQTQETPSVETPQTTIETVDDLPLSSLTINTAVDSPQLIRHYTNGWTTNHPWELIKDLPVTVTIKKFDGSGIELEGVPQGKYENDRWERTSTFWAFDENGNELGYEDNAYTSYPEPKRFYGKAKYILVVRCSDVEPNFHAIARSRVVEVK